MVQVCVGSSVNSSYEDMATVAAVLEGRSVHPDVALTVTPGSRQILDTIVRGEVYRTLTAAGARMLEPVCGPCIGIGQAPTSGQASVRRSTGTSRAAAVPRRTVSTVLTVHRCGHRGRGDDQ